MEKDYIELCEELNAVGVKGNDLLKWLKSDTVYTLLRFGVKNPDRSGVSFYEDDHYDDLYELVTKLRNNS